MIARTLAFTVAVATLAWAPSGAFARSSFSRGVEHALVYMAARKATEMAVSAGERAYRPRGAAHEGSTGETVSNPMAR